MGERVIGLYGYCTGLGDTFGGVEAQVWHLARYLRAAGQVVVVHCLASPLAGWHVTEQGELTAGRRLREAEPGMWEVCGQHGPGLPGAVAEHAQIGRKLGESVVLAFGTRDGYAFQLACGAAEQLAVPLVAFVYFTGEERWWRAQLLSHTRSIPGIATPAEREAAVQRDIARLRSVLAQATAVVVPTDYVRGQLAALVDPPQATRILVAYHGVDPAVFPPRAEGWGAGGPWLHVSRTAVPFAGCKNVTWSARLLAAAAERFPDARLDVCGAGNAAGLLEEFAARHNLGDRLNAVGFLPQHELAARYRAASVLLVPSMMEAGATTVVESALSGCLPVGLDVAGTGEMLRALGLADFLLPARPGQMGEHLTTIEPDLDAALALLARLAEQPDWVNQRLITAAALARERYTLGVTTRC